MNRLGVVAGELPGHYRNGADEVAAGLLRRGALRGYRRWLPFAEAPA